MRQNSSLEEKPMIKTFYLAEHTQSVHLVPQTARRGAVDDGIMCPCIASLLKIDAEDALDVYGGLAELRAVVIGDSQAGL